MVNKTVVIWDECDANVRFCVVDQDLSRLNGLYMNSDDISNEDFDSIHNIMYNEDGSYKVALTHAFPVDAVKAGAKVIVCGCLP